MTKKIILSAIIVALLMLGWFNRVKIHDFILYQQKPTLPAPISLHDLNPKTYNLEPKTSTTPPIIVPNNLPASFNLLVPFTSQAPHADWGQPYQDACEEASVITVHYFWSDQTFTPDKADAEILKFVAFENQQLGSPTGYMDTDAATTARLVEQYWPQYQTRVIYNWTIEQVETEIAAGHPVVAFFAGKELNNPNFTNGGPLYHALVIKGYTADNFITNDVGTRRGSDYIYSKQILLNASHDWNNGDVAHGRRAILVMWQK